jgi:hypothetical protein
MPAGWNLFVPKTQFFKDLRISGSLLQRSGNTTPPSCACPYILTNSGSRHFPHLVPNCV